jgi:hypothetical protein
LLNTFDLQSKAGSECKHLTVARVNADMLRMNTHAKPGRSALEAPMAEGWAAVLAYAMVVLVFVGDWLTPASFVVGEGYEVPVLFAALKGSRRLTIFTIALSSFGIALCWFVDLAQAGYVLSNARVSNRIFSLVSVWIVGGLALGIQAGAQNAAPLDAERALRRESALSAGLDRFAAALSSGTTVQALTSEAPRLLGAAAAVWCPAQGDGPFWATLEGAREAKILDVKPSASFDALMQRLSSQSSVEVVGAAETIDYLVGRPLGCERALAVPVGDGSKVAGVVFATLDQAVPSDLTLLEASNFAKFAGTALRAQSGNQLAHSAG